MAAEHAAVREGHQGGAGGGSRRGARRDAGRGARTGASGSGHDERSASSDNPGRHVASFTETLSRVAFVVATVVYQGDPDEFVIYQNYNGR